MLPSLIELLCITMGADLLKATYSRKWFLTDIGEKKSWPGTNKGFLFQSIIMIMGFELTSLVQICYTIMNIWHKIDNMRRVS